MNNIFFKFNDPPSSSPAGLFIKIKLRNAYFLGIFLFRIFYMNNIFFKFNDPPSSSPAGLFIKIKLGTAYFLGICFLEYFIGIIYFLNSITPLRG